MKHFKKHKPRKLIPRELAVICAMILAGSIANSSLIAENLSHKHFASSMMKYQLLSVVPQWLEKNRRTGRGSYRSINKSFIKNVPDKWRKRGFKIIQSPSEYTATFGKYPPANINWKKENLLLIQSGSTEEKVGSIEILGLEQIISCNVPTIYIHCLLQKPSHLTSVGPNFPFKVIRVSAIKQQKVRLCWHTPREKAFIQASS